MTALYLAADAAIAAGALTWLRAVRRVLRETTSP